MNKKEVLEIRKQYTHERCSITRICGCYVDGGKKHQNAAEGSFSFPYGRRNLQIF